MTDKLTTIALLACLAVIAPLYAIAQQLTPTIIILAQAEDDCPMSIDPGILLDAVERHGDVVHCIYQR